MTQNIFEKTIRIAMNLGFKNLNPNMSYDHFVEELNKDPTLELKDYGLQGSIKKGTYKVVNKIPTSDQLKNVDLFAINNNNSDRFALLKCYADSERLNFSFTPDFAKQFFEISKKLDLKKMKCHSLRLAPQIFQLSLPNFPHDVLIVRSNPYDKLGGFCITLAFYGNIAGPNVVQFQNIATLLNNFESPDSVILDFDDNPSVLGVGLENFKYIMNCILYITSGKPDIRDVRGHSFKGIDFSGKKGKRKFRKYKDVAFSDHIAVGWNFKKEGNRKGHWKWQAYGPKWGLHRLRFIESYLTQLRGNYEQ